MRKPRKQYQIKVIRREISDTSIIEVKEGLFSTTAVSIRQAWNNIRYQHGFNPTNYGSFRVEYDYQVIKVIDIDPDVDIYHKKDTFEPTPGEDISLFLHLSDEETKPEFVTINGVDYILTDNGEYTEIFD